MKLKNTTLKMTFMLWYLLGDVLKKLFAWLNFMPVIKYETKESNLHDLDRKKFNNEPGAKAKITKYF